MKVKTSAVTREGGVGMKSNQKLAKNSFMMKKGKNVCKGKKYYCK